MLLLLLLLYFFFWLASRPTKSFLTGRVLFFYHLLHKDNILITQGYMTNKGRPETNELRPDKAQVCQALVFTQ